MRELYKKWLINVASNISKKLYRPEEINCPDCGEKCIDYLYIGDEKTRIGYMDVWCSSCLNGIHICRASIPQGLKMLTFEETKQIDLNNIIPNFKMIEP